MDTKEQKTIDTKAEITEIQIVEPQILSADLSITTNFEDVKTTCRLSQKSTKGWLLLIKIKRIWKNAPGGGVSPDEYSKV